MTAFTIGPAEHSAKHRLPKFVAMRKHRNAKSMIDSAVEGLLPWRRRLGHIPESERRVARQTLWLNGITVVQVVGGLAQISIVARVLGPAGYGTLAVIMAASSLVFGLVRIPGGNTVTTFVTRSLSDGKYREAADVLRFAFAASLVLALVAYVVLLGLAFAGSRLVDVGDTYVDALLLYGVVGLLLSLQSEANAVLRLSDRVWMVFAVMAAGTLTRIGILGAVWLQDGGLLGVIVAYVVSAAVESSGLLAFAVLSTSRAGLGDLMRGWSIKVPSDVLRFHAGMFGRSTVGTLNQNLDVLLVAQFTTMADAGLYRASRQILDLARRPFGSLSVAIEPEYSRQWYGRDGASVRRTVRQFTVVSSMFALLVFGVLAMARDSATDFVLGGAFSGVASVLLILIPGQFLAAASAPLGSLPLATGRVWASLLPMVLGLATAIGAFIWLVPTHGVEGAAWAKSIQYFVAVPVLMLVAASIWMQSRHLQEPASAT